MMKIFTKLSVLLLLSILSFSCVFTGIEGSGNVTEETRTIDSEFVAVKVSQGIELLLTQDSDVSFKAEMDDNLHELLEVEVEDGELSISFKENVGRRKTSNVYLSMPVVEGLTSSSGAEILCKNVLKVDGLELSASSGSEMKLKLVAKEVDCSASSGSSIEIKGKATSFGVDSSSGSSVDADKFIAEKVVADASSGSSIDVHATESVIASASSGASIDCTGNPTSKSSDKSSGGSVRIE